MGMPESAMMCRWPGKYVTWLARVSSPAPRKASHKSAMLDMAKPEGMHRLVLMWHVQRNWHPSVWMDLTALANKLDDWCPETAAARSAKPFLQKRGEEGVMMKEGNDLTTTTSRAWPSFSAGWPRVVTILSPKQGRSESVRFQRVASPITLS